MSDTINCKTCGAEIEVMIHDHPDEWVMIHDYDHDDGFACSGCNRVTRYYEDAECECGEWFGVFVEYAQPCNAQGYVNILSSMPLDDVTPEKIEGWKNGSISL